MSKSLPFARYVDPPQGIGTLQTFFSQRPDQLVVSFLLSFDVRKPYPDYEKSARLDCMSTMTELYTDVYYRHLFNDMSRAFTMVSQGWIGEAWRAWHPEFSFGSYYAPRDRSGDLSPTSDYSEESEVGDGLLLEGSEFTLFPNSVELVSTSFALE